MSIDLNDSKTTKIISKPFDAKIHLLFRCQLIMISKTIDVRTEGIKKNMTLN